MNLDEKIINGKTYLDCFDVEEAKQFIGKRGYFANCNGAYEDLDLVSTGYKLVYASLKEVDEQKLTPFTSEFCEDFYFFLPEEWVVKKEEYRPYKNVKELFDDLGVYVGDAVHCRCRRSTSSDSEFHALITNYIETKDETKLCLSCNMHYTMLELFEYYEIHTANGWKPFGKRED